MDVGPDPQRRRLLIAGDPALARGLMRMVLSRLGYVVSVVGSGTEALVMRAHTRFALALVASRLPDMPGVVLTRHLGEPTVGPAVPVLMFGDALDQAAALRDGGPPGLVGFLVKPVSIGRLVGAVKALTEGSSVPPVAAEIAMPLEPPLDLERLREFTNGDRQLERELATLFVESAAVYIGQMRGALDDPEGWSRAAHALKGASVNIGAVEIARTAARAERTAPDPALVEELESQLGAVRRFLADRPRAPAPAR